MDTIDFDTLTHDDDFTSITLNPLIETEMRIDLNQSLCSDFHYLLEHQTDDSFETTNTLLFPQLNHYLNDSSQDDLSSHPIDHHDANNPIWIHLEKTSQIIDEASEYLEGIVTQATKMKEDYLCPFLQSPITKIILDSMALATVNPGAGGWALTSLLIATSKGAMKLSEASLENTHLEKSYGYFGANIGYHVNGAIKYFSELEESPLSGTDLTFEKGATKFLSKNILDHIDDPYKAHAKNTIKLFEDFMIFEKPLSYSIINAISPTKTLYSALCS